ncbi:GEVED domain-containing protein [uncultured Winogradskyella sp.]|uniref:GEVED domain-containing protein n=1 Tax=uncultured Winogradskyella sp. TaxID=395353 RepID=UPI00262412E3|nr:GEVED domain-containing protein [uncultured Winogradskyella sp.]
MKKITLILIMLSFVFTAHAQYVFNPVAGPINVLAGAPPTVNLNDTANTAGAAASSTGSYNAFSITVDWVAGGGNPWSSEADLTFTTSAGSVTVDPPTTGGANSNANATLIFEGDLPGVYNPTVDGYIDLVFNQSFAGSDANWSNIVVTLFESPTCVVPTGMTIANLTTTSVDLNWMAGDSESAWNVEYNGGADFTPGNGEAEGAVNVTTTPSTSLSGLTAFTEYFVYYQANCSAGDLSEWVGPFNFLTGYCESMPSSNDGQGITQVILGNQTFTSAGDEVYEDFRIPTVDLASSVTANFQITFATGFTYDVNVWIDFNNDLVFDNATELVFQGETTNDNPTVFDASFVMPNAPLGVYNMRMGSADFGQGTPNPCYNGSFGVTADFTVNVTAAPECAPASSLIAENITETTADLSWTDIAGTGVTWDLEWGPAGFTPGTGTQVPGLTVTNYLLTGLTAGTSYDYYVLTNCATTSSTLSGPSNFITDTPGETCANAFPMTVETDCDGTNAVTFNFANGGDIDANDENPTCDAFGNFGYFISFTAPAVGSVVINFDGAADNIGLEVYDSCGGTAVSDCTNNAFDAGDDSGIIGGLVPGDTYVAVIWRDTASGTADICIEAGPTCPQPVDLTFNILTTTSVELGWTEFGTATNWNVEYGLTGFTQGTGTLINGTTDNPLEVTGLATQTSYEFYVQSICDGGDVSDWSGPFEFNIDYCDSEPTSNDGQGVTNVTIETIDFPSLGDVTYEDQTSPVIDVLPGVNTSVAITFATGFTYNTNIWIDFNDNLTFEASELVFQGESTNANPTTLDASFVMPVTATPGQHRMRMGTADFGQSTPDPCFNGAFGVTLDFTVNVGVLPCVLHEVSFNIVDDCDNQQFFIDVDITDFGDAPSLEISNTFNTNTQIVTTTGVVQLGPYPSLTTLNVSVANTSESLCTITSPELQFICPPSNDTPCEATIAVVNEGILCESTTPGTIFGASASGVPDPTCGGSPDDDVWFQFVAESESHLISLANVNGSSVFDTDHSVYEGTCDNLTEISCTSGFDELSSVASGLTVGETYFVRIYSGGTDDEDTFFELCITPYIAPSNVTCDVAANFCSGSDATDILYTYNTIGISPGDGQIDCLFTTPNPTFSTLEIGSSGDILIEMVQNTAFDENDNPIGDELDVDFLLWGPYAPGDDLCNLGAVVDCSYSAAPVENVTLLNAQQGEIYLLLITNFAQDAGVIQVRQTNIGDNDAGSTIADIEAEIVSNDVFIDPSNDPTEVDEVSVCGFDSVTIETDSPFADSYIWFRDGFVIEGETGPSITVTESDNYQVQAFDSQCGSDAFSQIVIVNLYQDPGTVDPQNLTVCDGPGSDGSETFDLDAFSASLGYGSDFTVSYYTNTSDANQTINAVTSPYTSSGETLILRVEDADAASDGFLGCRQLSQLELVVNVRPDAMQPQDFIVCDDLDGSVDGQTDFNLTSIDDEISTNPNATITYHTSQADADTNVGALSSPYTSSGETIFARVEDSATGCFETTSFNLVVNVVPLATFDDQFDYQVCPNATVPVTIGIIPDNFTATDVTVTWLLDGVVIAGETDLTLDTVLVEGDYSAELSFNTTGCVNTITTFVEELESCIFPEGISPGVSPGQNDRFDLSSFGVTELKIFNRNGTLVYSKTDYTDEWEGQTNDGEELPVGTYFYTVIYEGGTKQKSAWVYINR